MKNKILISIIVTALIFGGIGFFVGMRYQQSKNPRLFARNFSGNANFSGRTNQGNQNNFRPVSGEILSVDDKSITVKLPDGSSKIVILGDSTNISKSESASKEDLKVGEKISAFGSLNQDGSITASNIQLNPVFRGQ